MRNRATTRLLNAALITLGTPDLDSPTLKKTG